MCHFEGNQKLAGLTSCRGPLGGPAGGKCQCHTFEGLGSQRKVRTSLPCWRFVVCYCGPCCVPEVNVLCDGFLFAALHRTCQWKMDVVPAFQ